MAHRSGGPEIMTIAALILGIDVASSFQPF
jgi:hypothetical protein